MKIIFFNPLYASPNKSDEKIHTFVYEIYDKRYCFLTPEPFLCVKCLEQDMQFGRILKFKEEEIYRIYTCIPYVRKYLY